jgi:hypothetical protein
MRSHLPQRLLDEELEPEARGSAILDKFLMSIMHAQMGPPISDNREPDSLREREKGSLVQWSMADPPAIDSG